MARSSGNLEWWPTCLCTRRL